MVIRALYPTQTKNIGINKENCNKEAASKENHIHTSEWHYDARIHHLKMSTLLAIPRDHLHSYFFPRLLGSCLSFLNTWEKQALASLNMSQFQPTNKRSKH